MTSKFFLDVCSEMIPLKVVKIDGGSSDPNWEFHEFEIEWYKPDPNGGWDLLPVPDNEKIVKLNEHKSVGKHSKQVYDWEILELFFRHHNLVPNFPKTDRNYDLTLEEQKIAEVNNMNLESIFTSISMCITKYIVKHKSAKLLKTLEAAL